MQSRRHLLPAIYNPHLEKFHYAADAYFYLLTFVILIDFIVTDIKPVSFQNNGDRIIEFEGIQLKMPLKLYAFLQSLNKRQLYISDFFDVKLVSITTGSFILQSELHDGNEIQADDVRLNFAHGK